MSPVGLDALQIAEALFESIRHKEQPVALPPADPRSDSLSISDLLRGGVLPQCVSFSSDDDSTRTDTTSTTCYDDDLDISLADIQNLLPDCSSSDSSEVRHEVHSPHSTTSSRIPRPASARFVKPPHVGGFTTNATPKPKLTQNFKPKAGITKEHSTSGRWTAQEDMALIQAVSGLSEDEQAWRQKGSTHYWKVVSQRMGGTRSNLQCRERWRYHLDPDLDHSEFTRAEDDIIFEGVRELGYRWKEIVARLPTKPATCSSRAATTATCVARTAC